MELAHSTPQELKGPTVRQDLPFIMLIGNKDEYEYTDRKIYTFVTFILIICIDSISHLLFAFQSTTRLRAKVHFFSGLKHTLGFET